MKLANVLHIDVLHQIIIRIMPAESVGSPIDDDLFPCMMAFCLLPLFLGRTPCSRPRMLPSLVSRFQTETQQKPSHLS